MHRTKPLYRRVNTRTHGVRHGTGQKSKYERGQKSTALNQSQNGSMHSYQKHGLDYTPLFKFLLSKIGQDWDDVHSAAVARLDKSDPIFWMVAHSRDDAEPYFRSGESSYFNTLFVNADNKLECVDPALTHETMKPFCACCTHTLNGQRLTQKFGSTE